MQHPSRFNNFDLIRLVAAAQVVFVHAVGHTPVLEAYPPWLRTVLDLVILFPGVAVFFVISGYLVPRSYERLRDRPKAYVMHRALRIYPALWVCLAVTLGVLGWFGFLGRDVLGSGVFWAWLGGQVSVGQFFNPEFFRGFGVGAVNGALWTISVELQFYALVPLWDWLTRRERAWRFLFAAAFIVSFAAFCYVDHGSNREGGFHEAPMAAKLLFVTLIPHWWMFALGILAHRHRERLAALLEGRFLPHFAAYCAFAGVRQLAVGRELAGGIPFYAGYLPERVLLATLTLAAAFTARGLSGRLLRGADISYGVYIYHFLIINVLLQTGRMDSLGSVALVFALAVAAGAASWFGVEKRALSFKPKPAATAGGGAG